MPFNNNTVFIPADVPPEKANLFEKNYRAITNNGNLFLFACDQKIEHLNDDFYQEPNTKPARTNLVIHPHAMHPEHLFAIASKAPIGAMAAPLGLIARYAKQYPTVNYIAKLNGKTNLVSAAQRDPRTRMLWSVDQAVSLSRNSGSAIRGIGITLYMGSAYEHEQLSDAAQAINHAHQEGLVAIAWIYPRGAAITDDTTPELIAGAAGLANALGADFVKVKPPHSTSHAPLLQVAAAAAGNTKIIYAAGEQKEPQELLNTIADQMYKGGAHGCAVGRNLFQRSEQDALQLAHDIAHIVYTNPTQ